MSETSLNDLAAYHSELNIYNSSPTLRKFNLIGEFSSDMARHFTNFMSILQYRTSHEHITITINSNGGSESDGWSIYDQIRLTELRGIKVTIIITGEASSMAALVVQAASTRIMHENATFLIHNGAIGDEVSKRDDIDRKYKEGLASSGRYHKALLKGAQRTNSKMTLRKIKSMCLKDLPIDAISALRLGFVDVVI